MRFWISFALIPLYVHTTATTGMLISGKISTGMRRAAPMPSSAMRISEAITVYGRFSAIWTTDIKTL